MRARTVYGMRGEERDLPVREAGITGRTMHHLVTQLRKIEKEKAAASPVCCQPRLAAEQSAGADILLTLMNFNAACRPRVFGGDKKASGASDPPLRSPTASWWGCGDFDSPDVSARVSRNPRVLAGSYRCPLPGRLFNFLFKVG